MITYPPLKATIISTRIAYTILRSARCVAYIATQNSKAHDNYTPSRPTTIIFHFNNCAPNSRNTQRKSQTQKQRR